MSHLTSPAALRTARVILKYYDLAVRPPESLVSGRIDKLTNSEAHVSIVIDHATNIYQLTSLRPEICFWQSRLRFGNATGPQIAGFFKRLLDAFDNLPKENSTEEPTSTTFAAPTEHENSKPVVVRISKPSKEVSRFIFHYYIPTPKDDSKEDEHTHRLKIVYLAEASLGLRRTYDFFPKLQIELKRLVDGKATEIEIKKCMRAVGIVLEYIPTYADRREEGVILT